MGTSSEAKIGAALPKTEHGNGLHAIAQDLIASPEAVRYAVIRFDTGEVQHKYEIDEEGERYEVLIPKARIRAIEPLTGADANAAHRLMETARADRMGELPFHAIAPRLPAGD